MSTSQAGKGWARKLVGIRIAPDTALVSLGKPLTFSASGVFSDGRVRPISVSWQATGGTIDSDGVFTASRIGDYQVMGSEATTGLTDTAMVIADTGAVVDEPAPVVSSVAVTPSSATLAVGESVQLSANAKDVNGAPITGLPVTWTTSNSVVASVSSSGLVRALASGSAVVTATIQSVQGKANITIPAPVGTALEDCGSYPYDRLVSVSTAAQLGSAITNAQPGDLIELASGSYNGRWTISRSGTTAKKIVLCGPRTAVLNGGGVNNWDAVIAMSGATNWVIGGITLTNAQRGVYVNGGVNVRLTRLEIHTIGQEAIHLRQFSKHNLVDSNYIHDTGKTTAQYGEGIYVGTWHGQWPNLSTPDRSDSNTVRDNIVGPNLGSEAIDIKDGVTGTIVAGNRMDGARSGYPSVANLQSLLIVIGNDNLITGNIVVRPPKWGMEVEQLLVGWGYRNTFHGNTLTMSGASGPGFFIGSPEIQVSTVVGCDNTVADASFSNIGCIR